MELDETDRGLLHILQRDARRIPTQEMAEMLNVSTSTVRNRINGLEEAGVIRGYRPEIDYGKAGLQLHVEIICSAANPDRERLAAEACDVRGVVAVREVINGSRNVQIDAVGTDAEDVARVTDEISERGLQVANTKIIKNDVMQPFDHFGAGVTD